MNVKFLVRVLLKAAGLFALLNVLFAALDPLHPLDALGRSSVYNTLLRGRERLPYGENPARSYSLSPTNLPTLFASHRLSAPPASDEFRVLLLGDSGTWGWRLPPEHTLAAQLTAAGLTTPDGRRVVVYNLGYPVMSLLKDVLLLDEARHYQPDALIWLVTLESFPRDKQLFPLLVQQNAARVRGLISTQQLALDPHDARLVTPDFWARTLVGQRRALADWLRLQTYGISWAATGIDQDIPPDYTPRQSDLAADATWQGQPEHALTADELAWDVLQAGLTLAAGRPVLVVNEPIFISTGQNSAVRYNSFYPRWAYDQYRTALPAALGSTPYLDLWDALPPAAFTDTPVHTTAEGVQQVAAQIATAFRQLIGG